MGYDFYEQVEGGHGRVETRRVGVTRDVQWLQQRGPWAGAVCVESRREVLDPAGGPPKCSTQRRYFITSHDHRQRGKDAAFFAGLIRDQCDSPELLNLRLLNLRRCQRARSR